MILADILRPNQCGVGRRYADKDACLVDLASRAAHALDIPPANIVEALRHREELGSTGLGNGIALPHARIAGISKPYISITTLRGAIAFDAIDDRPVDIVCLILLPAAGPAGNDVLGCVVRRLRDAATLAASRKAKDASALHAALT